MKWQFFRPIRLAVWIAGLLLGLYFALKGNDFYRGFAFLALSVFALYPPAFALAVRYALANNWTITEPTIMSVFPWGIVSKTSSRSVSLAWENFDGFVQTDKLVILRLRRTKQVVVLPKRDLDAVQLSTLLEIVSRRLPAK